MCELNAIRVFIREKETYYYIRIIIVSLYYQILILNFKRKLMTKILEVKTAFTRNKWQKQQQQQEKK